MGLSVTPRAGAVHLVKQAAHCKQFK